jgi:uncharacterized membrane protein (UPF0127 family)
MGSSRKAIGLAFAFMLANSAFAGECAEDQVFLKGDWGQAHFTVEVADDDRERAQGLMNRESLPKASGMLFVYPRPRLAGFWMKNTLIPLDMIFLDRTGTVTHIHHEAIPHDETPIIGGDNVLAVLEINGGLARQMGIETGSQMRHPAFDAEFAAWPCPAD